MIARQYFMIAMICLVSANVMAQNRYSYGTKTTSSSTDSDSDSNDAGFALGYSSNAAALFYDSPGLTGLFPIGDNGAIQAYFALYDSDPNTYGIGAIYKYTISGNQSSGFHVGGGLGLGTWSKDKSYMHIIGDAGIHFSIKKHVLVHIDGGLLIKSDEQAANNAPKDSGMVLAGFSEHIGLAIMYMF
ncbi:MAG: hypothetical protein SGJ18_09565 [Pseudomonadota bacterium]|nr:hypothetical protein [Pseudomonadota bacterium]